MSAPRILAALVALTFVTGTGCTSGSKPTSAPVVADAAPGSASGTSGTSAGKTILLSIVGTSDLHGNVLSADGRGGGLDVFAGYLTNLRKVRARDGGGVVLVDAGDMFQGTIESNLGEGAMVVDAYNALGYTAVAIGNHEFDFGPVGDSATPKDKGDDPRGALKARAAEAKFPFLAANVVDSATGAPVAWPNVRPSVIVDVAGVKVGLIGVTTEATPRTTMAANFAGLAVTPLADAIAREAKTLREQGAVVVVAIAHAGGKCAEFDDPRQIFSCDLTEEIIGVAAALPPGVVDVIVAGHSHQGMAHFVSNIPVIQSFASGRSFGRVDLTLDTGAGKVVGIKIHEPKNIAPGDSYEGHPVVADAAIAAAAADDAERARVIRDAPLGVTLEDELQRSHDKESEVGDLFADMMLAAVPGADVAITNGGGLRADLPAGALTYGRLYTAYPFDNRFARVRLTGGELRAMVVANLGKSGGILSVAGVRATVTCKDNGTVDVTLTRRSGKVIKDNDKLVVVTSDFLATGGDKTFTALAPEAIEILDTPLIRDGIATALRKRGGSLRGPTVYDPKQPRLAFKGMRPVKCPVRNGR